MKPLLRSMYRAIIGGGEPSLLKRKRYHEMRAVAERRALSDQSHGRFLPAVCPACGSNDVRERFKNPVGFGFAQCLHDGMVYMDPLPSSTVLHELYNDPSYAEFWSTSNSIDDGDVQRVSKLPGSTLLDVGCASGDFLIRMRDRFQCSGVEITESSADNARRRGFEVITGTLDDVDGAERFDVVTMLQVIEHLSDPVASLHDVHRLLAPSGRLYLNTPCVDSASFGLFRERHVHVSSFGHVSLFTKGALEIVAQRAGFRVVQHGYCGGLDVGLHDLIGRRLSDSYRHRTAFYSPRFMNACRAADTLLCGYLPRALTPRGNQSYLWAVLQKVPKPI
jgi:SAM-dependent methyltransferase